MATTARMKAMIKDSDHRQGAVVAIAVLKKNIVGCHHLAGPGDLESSLALGAHGSHVELLDFAENFLDPITVAPGGCAGIVWPMEP